MPRTAFVQRQGGIPTQGTQGIGPGDPGCECQTLWLLLAARRGRDIHASTVSSDAQVNKCGG